MPWVARPWVAHQFDAPTRRVRGAGRARPEARRGPPCGGDRRRRMASPVHPATRPESPTARDSGEGQRTGDGSDSLRTAARRRRSGKLSAVTCAFPRFTGGGRSSISSPPSPSIRSCSARRRSSRACSIAAATSRTAARATWSWLILKTTGVRVTRRRARADHAGHDLRLRLESPEHLRHAGDLRVAAVSAADHRQGVAGAVSGARLAPAARRPSVRRSQASGSARHPAPLARARVGRAVAASSTPRARAAPTATSRVSRAAASARDPGRAADRAARR